MTEEQLNKVDWLNRAFRADQKVNALIAVQEQNKSLACRCTASTVQRKHKKAIEEQLRKLKYRADLYKEYKETIK